MGKYEITPKISFLLILVFFLLGIKVNAQDSLYLVGTITGESADKQITDVSGIGDINGDGYDDFMVSSRTGMKVRDQGVVKLYLGSADGNLIPDVTFHYPGEDTLNFFGTSYDIGDINNDSYDDFVITGLFGDWGYAKGKVFIYLGGSTIDTLPVKEFNEPWIDDSFGYPTESLGDINKDGYDDFIIGSPYNWSNGKGYAYLFWGGDTISWERCDTISGDLFYPQSYANIGDINNDSFDDIAIGAPEIFTTNDSGKVFIYYGGKQMDTEPDTILTSDSSCYDFGRIIKNVGDINRDGIIDFCITGSPYVFIYNNYFSNPLKVNGYSLDAGGDINNDGYSDLIIGSDWKINVYLGSENFEPVSPIEINDPGIGFTGNISIGGDINNDGYDEIFALATNYPSVDDPQGRLFIYSYKLLTGVNVNNLYIPNNFELYQNYPNPFNPGTNIKFTIPNVVDANFASTINVQLKIYDILGNEIATLVDEQKSPGIHEVEFDGSGLTSGIYFYRLTNGNYSKTKQMMLLK